MKERFFVAFSFAQPNTHLFHARFRLLCCLFCQLKRREFQFRRLACALPHWELNILGGEIAGDIVTFIGKLVKEPNTNIAALWGARDHAFSPAPKRTNAERGRCREEVFSPSTAKTGCIIDEVIPFSALSLFAKRENVFLVERNANFRTTPLCLTICAARATSAFQGLCKANFIAHLWKYGQWD